VAVTFAFVESIGGSTRLDLNSSPWKLLAEGTTFGRPELRRQISGNMLIDGQQISAEAYGNREMVLRFELNTSTADQAAAEQQKLFRELDRPRNILRYKPHTSTDVWFRTYRAGPEEVTLDGTADGTTWTITVNLLAEPFAYGAKHTVLSGQSISMNPANSNGMYRDITGVRGDVEAPAQIIFPASQVAGFTSAVAIRRRGTPSNVPFLCQAESLTTGTNTSAQANNSDFSGSGNNWVRTTFGTPTNQIRMSTTAYPSTPSVDARGMYKVFARLRRDDAVGEIYIQLNNNAPVRTNLGVAMRMFELGEVVIPGGMDPVVEGPSGVELAAAGVPLEIRAERQSGSSDLQYDYFLFFPADNISDRFAMVTWPSATSGFHVFDGYNGAVYNIDASGAVTNSAASFIGNVMMLTPNQTNRLFFCRKAFDIADALTDSVTVTVAYYPRYLNVAPVGS